MSFGNAITSLFFGKIPFQKVIKIDREDLLKEYVPKRIKAYIRGC